LKDIISIDESSLSTSLAYNYCRGELGKRCIKKIDDNSVFQKYSLIVAINNKKCINYKLYDKGAVNSERFNEFLTYICKNVKKKLIVLDNDQIHKKESTKKIIKDSGNFLLYTCPYHPRLNAIEQWFNQLKHYIKLDKPTNLNQQKKSLKESVTKIKKEHYKITLFMLTIKIIIKIRKQIKSLQNTENPKFIKIKNRHLKYAPL
jgi:transposase